jgi:DegV family protein with EDD domain
LSGTYASATAAANELDGKVRTVDTGTASAAIAMLGLAIQRRLEHGTNEDEIAQLIERFERDAGLIFTVDTLEFLRRGGRIGRASAWAGGLLHVKPILTIKREVVPLKRVRGNQKAMQTFVDEFTSHSEDVASLRVGIAHADAPERARQLEKMVRGERPQAQVELVTTLGAVVGTHAGPGTVGFFWFDDR